MPLNKYFLTHLVTQAWQKKGLLALLLLPLSYVFALIGFIRRQKKTDAKLLPCPILVVGNLSVGGTGKTPLTIALIDFCHQAVKNRLMFDTCHQMTYCGKKKMFVGQLV